MKMAIKLRTLSVAVAGALALLLAALGGTAVAKDRNHDRIPDKWEKRHHLSLNVDQSNRDSDRDKVDNRNEFQEGTNPRDKDSDDDGRKDGREDSDRDGLNNMGEDDSSNLPNDRDTDDDGVRDGEENAGTIASFDGTTLVINLAGGTGQVSGTVTAATEIKCESEDSHELTDRSDDRSGRGKASAASHGADDPPGDEHGGDRGGADDRLCSGTVAAHGRVRREKLRSAGAG